MEALDADAIRSAAAPPPIGGGAAAGRMADTLGTPNVNVTAFVVGRFVDRGLLVDLSAIPDGTLHHPDQVAEVCRREDVADLVAADTPLGHPSVRHRIRSSGTSCLPSVAGGAEVVAVGPLRRARLAGTCSLTSLARSRPLTSG
ncbi:hypothetical protein [Streptomyces flaveolus]|uniref:hypothetical protein n=1 Tax=Streptomyces flaveolus TaxID=67297 RepID=UPI0036FEA1C7